MKLYMIEYDNGGDYEMRETEIIGIYDDLDLAKEFIVSCGFIQFGEEENYFVRKHDNVPGECVEHEDFTRINTFELNIPVNDIDCFTHHYKYIVPHNVLNYPKQGSYIGIAGANVDATCNQCGTKRSYKKGESVHHPCQCLKFNRRTIVTQSSTNF